MCSEFSKSECENALSTVAQAVAQFQRKKLLAIRLFVGSWGDSSCREFPAHLLGGVASDMAAARQQRANKLRAAVALYLR
jgi:hypothetical protein